MTNPSQTLPIPHMGLPQWNSPNWHTGWLNGISGTSPLARYAQVCSSVEGNTTFYQTPARERIEQWRDSVPEGFRFCFKLPRDISHLKMLKNAQRELDDFIEVLSPLGEKMGLLFIQLPAAFDDTRLGDLDAFLDQASLHCRTAVEVRHPSFFAKGKTEVEFNRLLMAHRSNRVIIDTRALFSHPPATAAEIEAQRKKPRVPVNVIATSDMPMIRLVGGDDEEENARISKPWIDKVHQWREQQKQVYLFFHRPDNADAPKLMQQFILSYNHTYPSTPLPDKCEQQTAVQNPLNL